MASIVPISSLFFCYPLLAHFAALTLLFIFFNQGRGLQPRRAKEKDTNILYSAEEDWTTHVSIMGNKIVPVRVIIIIIADCVGGPYRKRCCYSWTPCGIGYLDDMVADRRNKQMNICREMVLVLLRNGVIDRNSFYFLLSGSYSRPQVAQ